MIFSVDPEVSKAWWDGATSVVSWLSDKLLAPALVAVAFTGLTNFVLEKYKAERDQATKIADGLRDDLKALQQASIEYWSRAQKPDDAAVEARITASQTDFLITLELLADKFGMIITPNSSSDLTDLLDALTGGSFGQANRAADPSRVVKLTAAISNFRARVTVARVDRLRRGAKGAKSIKGASLIDQIKATIASISG